MWHVYWLYKWMKPFSIFIENIVCLHQAEAMKFSALYFFQFFYSASPLLLLHHKRGITQIKHIISRSFWSTESFFLLRSTFLAYVGIHRLKWVVVSERGVLLIRVKSKPKSLNQNMTWLHKHTSYYFTCRGKTRLRIKEKQKKKTVALVFGGPRNDLSQPSFDMHTIQRLSGVNLSVQTFLLPIRSANAANAASF